MSGCEMNVFRKVAEKLDVKIYGQQLTVISTVAGLSWL